MLNKDQIIAGLPAVLASPRDGGSVEAIVIRPAVDQREFRDRVFLSPEEGVAGDRWKRTSWLKLPDGSPDPRVQVSLMNARILKLISLGVNRMSLAGDNLIVDLDLSAENLPPGQRVKIGECVIEITELPHTGCGKFLSRYGRDAVQFINSAEGKKLHLRGLYARVIAPGYVQIGDALHKLPGH